MIKFKFEPFISTVTNLHVHWSFLAGGHLRGTDHGTAAPPVAGGPRSETARGNGQACSSPPEAASPTTAARLTYPESQLITVQVVS